MCLLFTEMALAAAMRQGGEKNGGEKKTKQCQGAIICVVTCKCSSAMGYIYH